MSCFQLYFVTPQLEGPALIDLVVSACKGGVSCVQWRHKTLSERAFVQTGQQLVRALRPLGATLLVNDHVHLVEEIGAQGAHIGQSDGSVYAARQVLGPKRILGLSLESLGNAHRALEVAHLLDYVAVSPVFSTATKTDAAAALGLEGLRAIKALFAHLPVLAIGGINLANAAAVHEAGADGLCVVSAISAANDPQAAARELAQLIKPSSL